jgi:hypothetical protein
MIMAPNVFVSVGTPFLKEQEDFVEAVEQHLSASGLIPQRMARARYRNTGRPLQDVANLMKECSGTVVIAFERKHIRDGVEKRGSTTERPMKNETIPTVWNHIEAAQAYMLGQPVLVIAVDGLYSEGLIENNYDWYVRWVPLDTTALKDPKVEGIFAHWVHKVKEHHRARQEPDSNVSTERDPGALTIRELVGSLTVGQFWGVIVAIVTALSAVAAVAYMLGEAGVFSQ